MLVSWNAPTGITTGVAAYDVRYIETSADEAVDSNWIVEVDAWKDGGGSLTYAVTGLTNGTEYDVQVRAVDVDDVDGAWSATTSATPADHGNTRAAATSVTAGARVWGAIDPADDEDYFSFSVPRTADYWIYTLGDLDTVGELFDNTGMSIDINDRGSVLPNPDNFFLWRKLQTGTYYIKVTGYGSTDEPYILRVREFTDTTSRSNAATLAIDGFASGTIDPEYDQDYFKLELSQSTEIAIRASGFPDTVGQLQNSSGFLIASNNDGHLPGNRRNFLIRENLAAGVYYVKVRSFAGRSDGPYSVYAAAITEPGSAIADAQPLTFGGTAGGIIDPAGDEDYFSLTLTETTYVTIGGVSHVTNISGGLTDENDLAAPVDSIHFDDTFIFQGRLDAGTYYLKVTGKDATDTGRYTVRAIEEGGYTSFVNRCSNISRSSGINDPLYGCQWHLNNDNQFRNSAGQDIRVEEVWPTYTGSGINVAVVDDGMHHQHEDLTDNVLTSFNHNYDPDLTDIYHPFEDHGTAVAGLIAAKDNSLGMRGVAPGAKIYGYNYLVEQTDANEANAMSRNAVTTAISNNSWGPGDSGHPEPATELWEAAVEDGVTTGYDGKGVFYAWAAGNGGEDDDYSTLDEYSNFYAVTAVCAVGHDDIRSSYSEAGANLWVCGPSSSGRGDQPRIATTDNGHLYRGSFGGTSAATPIVSGVVALVREANSALTWRDVKLILAASARKNDPDNTGWVEGAFKYGSTTDRYNFNHEYGFGMVDAKAAVDLAPGWTNVRDLREITAESSVINLPIPDFPSSGTPTTVTTSLTIDPFVEFVEFVEVNAHFYHANFRDLTVELVSPSGTVSTLSTSALIGGALATKFRFGSARHLGEDAAGEWTLRIKDLERVDTGALRSWGLTIYGHGFVPGAPEIDTVTPGGGTLAVEWNAPTVTGATAITSYDLRYIRDDVIDRSDTNWSEETGVGTLSNRSYTITGLRGGVKYDIQVRAHNSAGHGPWSQAEADEPTTVAPSAPAITSITRGDRSLAVVWTAPTDTGGADFTAYDVRFIETSEDEADDANWTVRDNAWRSGALRYVIRNLTNATEYDVQVRAVNSADDGDWSDTETGTPLPDDIPITLQWEETSLEVAEDIGNVVLKAIFTTTLNAPPAADFTFDVTITATDIGTTQNDDYAPPPTSATFVASDFSQTDVNGQQRYRATRDFTVAIIDDTTDESDEIFRVTLAYLTPGLTHLRGGPSTAVVTIKDNEHVPVTINWEQSDITVGENAGNVTLRAFAVTTEDKRPEDGFSFDASIYTSNGSAAQPGDYTRVDDSVTFSRSDFSRVTVNGERRYRAAKQVQVTIEDDTTDEIEEDFTVTIEYENPGPPHLQGGPATASIKITDNEYVPVTISWEQADISVGEDAGSVTLYARSTTTEAGNPLSDFSFDVRVTTSPGSAQQNDDYTSLNASETFLYSDFNATSVNGDLRYRAEKQFTIDIQDDIYDEPDEDFRVTLAYSNPRLPYLQGGTATATVTITNDDEGGPEPPPPPPPPPPPEPEPEPPPPPPANTPPSFPFVERGLRSVSENAAAGEDIGSPVEARDPQGDSLTYILGGDDAYSFDIGASSGQLLTKAALDYETKSSYRVIVWVHDGKDSDGAVYNGTDASQYVTIRVINVDEAGELTLSSDQPYIGGPLNAVVDDGDGSASGEVWKWERSADMSDWSVINGAASASYTPVEADRGSYLRVTASYTDGQGAGKSASIVSASAVVVNTAPRFPMPELSEDGVPKDSLERMVAENADAGEDAGAPVTADDPDGDALTYSLSGDDAASFDIDGMTGQLSTVAVLDYEAKAIYSLTVSVMDGKDVDGNDDAVVDDSIAVSVMVINEGEPGNLTLSSAQPRVGSSLVAVLTDPDGVVGEAEWVWHRSTNPIPVFETSWQVVSAAKTSSYTPVEADLGYYLRVTVVYDDGHGPGKQRQVVSDAEVVEFPGPSFPEAKVNSGRASGLSVVRSIAETASAGEKVGDLVVAESPNGSVFTYTLSGEDAALFTIDERTGQISVRTGTELDYESDKRSYTLWVTATDTSGVSSTVTVVIQITDVELSGIGRDYDANNNEVIDREEAIAAVSDYFRGLITKEETIEVIRLYFAG